MMWEEWAIVFSPLGKKLFCFPMEPPAILSMSTILEFLPEALTPALGYHIRRTTVFKISSDITIQFSSIQFSSVQLLSHVQLFVTLWTTACQASLSITNSWSPPKPTFHQVDDAIQPFHSLSSPSPPALNLSQHQGLFQWVSSSNRVAKGLQFQFQHQSFRWIFRTDLL